MQNHLDIIAAQRSRVQPFGEVAWRAPGQSCADLRTLVFGGRAE
jgi:hypothetical protein